MTVDLTRGVALSDLAAMRASAGLPEKVGTFDWAASHASKTRCWSAWSAGRCIACGGFFDHGGRFEAWFACRPEAAREIVGVLRAAHWTLRAVSDDGRVEIFARVAPGWRPGARIARAIGMRPAGLRDGWEIWEF